MKIENLAACFDPCTEPAPARVVFNPEYVYKWLCAVQRADDRAFAEREEIEFDGDEIEDEA